MKRTNVLFNFGTKHLCPSIKKKKKKNTLVLQIFLFKIHPPKRTTKERVQKKIQGF